MDLIAAPIDDEENKAMYEEQRQMVAGMSLTDNGIIEKDICKKCNKSRPPTSDEHTNEENDMWLLCEQCDSWTHAVCVLDYLKSIGVTDLSQEALEGVEFVCCTKDEAMTDAWTANNE